MILTTVSVRIENNYNDDDDITNNNNNTFTDSKKKKMVKNGKEIKKDKIKNTQSYSNKTKRHTLQPGREQYKAQPLKNTHNTYITE